MRLALALRHSLTGWRAGKTKARVFKRIFTRIFTRIITRVITRVISPSPRDREGRQDPGRKDPFCAPGWVGCPSHEQHGIDTYVGATAE
jgi:hypothetical protein